MIFKRNYEILFLLSMIFLFSCGNSTDQELEKKMKAANERYLKLEDFVMVIPENLQSIKPADKKTIKEFQHSKYPELKLKIYTCGPDTTDFVKCLKNIEDRFENQQMADRQELVPGVADGFLIVGKIRGESFPDYKEETVKHHSVMMVAFVPRPKATYFFEFYNLNRSFEKEQNVLLDLIRSIDIEKK